MAVIKKVPSKKAKRSKVGNWTVAQKRKLALELGENFYTKKGWYFLTGKLKK